MKKIYFTISYLTDEADEKVYELKEAEVGHDNKKRKYFVICLSELEKDILIVFRSHLPHSYGYCTSPNGKDGSGLDFSKSHVLDHSDIGKEAQIDSSEYNHYVKGHERRICKGFMRYLRNYIEAVERCTDGKKHKRDLNLMEKSTLQNYNLIMLKQILEYLEHNLRV